MLYEHRHLSDKRVEHGAMCISAHVLPMTEPHSRTCVHGIYKGAMIANCSVVVDCPGVP
jgi:hypothetical protein